MILFVGNISRITTEKELESLFSSYGPIQKLRIMVDKITRRSRGYAYIDMEFENDGYKSIDQLNNTVFMDNRIIVNAASSRQLHAIDWK